MADILPFARPQAAAPEEQYLRGAAVCLGCGHEWQAVLPVGGSPDTLSCTQCKGTKGVFRHFVRYPHPHWLCLSCEGGLFSVIQVQGVPSMACATCGQLRNAMDIFP